MKKTLSMILVLAMTLTMVTGISVSADVTTHSALPLSQNFEDDTFNAEITSQTDYTEIENGNFRLYTNDQGSWKVTEDITGLTGKVAELKNATAGKLMMAQRYFTKQTEGKVLVSFDTVVKEGMFYVYLANSTGANYGSSSSKADINVLTFNGNNNIEAQSGAYSISGDGIWVNNKPYHVDILFDIDDNKIYTTVDDNIITINDVSGTKAEMTALRSVSFKTMGENSCVYIDNLEVQAFSDSAQIFVGDVELKNDALNVVGLNTIDVNAVGVDAETIGNAKLYDLGTTSVVKTKTEIALTGETTDDGISYTMASAFEAGKFYQIDLTNVKTFYGAPLFGKPVNFKASADIKLELNHDFFNTAEGEVLDTAISSIAPAGKDSIVSIEKITGNDDVADGGALRLGDYNAETMDEDKANYRGKYGFNHSLKDEAFNIDVTQGGKLTVDYEFINKTSQSNYGSYALYLMNGTASKQIITHNNAGTVKIDDTTYENAVHNNDSSEPTHVNIVFDFDNGTITVTCEAKRWMNGKGETIVQTYDGNFVSSSSGRIRAYDGIQVLTESSATYGGYFDHFNVKYEKSELSVTDASFTDYKGNKVYAYDGETIPASTKALNIAFSSALTEEQISAITVADKSGNVVGTSSYDEKTNICTVTFDNYLKPNSEYDITVLGTTETITTDAGNFELFSRELTIDGNATLTVKLINTTGEEKTFLMAIASYTNGGLILEDVNVQEVVASDSQDKEIELTLGDYDKVKGFVWSGIDTIRPLFQSAVYTVGE